MMMTLPPHTLLALPLACAADADHVFALAQEAARLQGVQLRSPPPHPTSCCGRGCNGCVWEGFLAAAAFWREDAVQALADAGGTKGA